MWCTSSNRRKEQIDFTDDGHQVGENIRHRRLQDHQYIRAKIALFHKGHDQVVEATSVRYHQLFVNHSADGIECPLLREDEVASFSIFH